MTGVWVVYAYDMNAYFEAAYDTEIEAMRHAARETYCHAVFVKWGEGLSAAIARAETEAAV